MHIPQEEPWRHAPPQRIPWVRGKAKAFDGRWYPVEVVLVGPRSPRIVSIAGEVSGDAQIWLHAAVDYDDTDKVDQLRRDLGRAGWKNVELRLDKRNAPKEESEYEPITEEDP